MMFYNMLACNNLTAMLSIYALDRNVNFDCNSYSFWLDLKYETVQTLVANSKIGFHRFMHALTQDPREQHLLFLSVILRTLYVP